MFFFMIQRTFNCRGKRKLAQVTKEAKEQLAELQSKLEIANAGKWSSLGLRREIFCLITEIVFQGMMAKDAAIQALGKDIETARAEVKTTEETQVGKRNMNVTNNRLMSNFRKKYKMNLKNAKQKSNFTNEEQMN